MKPSSLSSRVQDFQWIISTINLNLERVSIKYCWSIIIFPLVRCITKYKVMFQVCFRPKISEISFDSHMTRNLWPTNQPYKIWRWKHVKIFDLYSRHESVYIYGTTCMSFISFCSKFVSSQFPQFLEQHIINSSSPEQFLMNCGIVKMVKLWKLWNFMGKLLKY